MTLRKTGPQASYRLIRCLLRMLSRIPRKLLGATAFPIGRLWYAVDRRHRRIALENLTLAMGSQMSPKEIRSTAKANFVQLARTALEIPALLKLTPDNVDDYMIFSGQEHYDQALSRGKGILFLTGHLGNWELMALSFSFKFGTPFHVMARVLDFEPMDRVMREIRGLSGNTVVNKSNSAAVVSRLLNENQVVGILLDQNASWYEGVYVPFFGRIVCTNKGMAMFALRYGAAVLPAFNTRQPDGRYRTVFEPPVELIRTGDVSRDIEENTALFNRIIEKNIRAAPDNWLWIHRRWRIKDIPERARRKLKLPPDIGAP